MIRRMLVAVLVLISNGPALAGTLSTPPFPGGRMATGEAYCSVSNDGTRPIEVTLELVSGSGSPVTPGSRQTITVNPGLTEELVPSLPLVTYSPFRCRFTASSTRTLRASFVWLKSSTDTPLVIPAY